VGSSLPPVLVVPAPPPEPKLPKAHEASQGPAWYGQTLEYAAGVCLRQQILEPILAEDDKALPEETARFLSYYSRGDLLFLQNASGAVHVANIERVTTADANTIAGWWDEDKYLPETGSEDWSSWWIKRCHLFDPGCEMVKLMGESGETLGMAYFERHVVDNRSNGGRKRITLIRGLRIHPKLNPETIRRSSPTRNATSPIAYPDVASSLLQYIMFVSIRYGTQGVAVNSPKSDTIEDFYQHYFGMPILMDASDGRRLFRMSADSRFEILRHAFREQLVLMTEYKDQIFLRKDAASEAQEYDAEENKATGAVLTTAEQLVRSAEDTATELIIPMKKEPAVTENKPTEETASPLMVFVSPQPQLEAPEGLVAPEEGEAKTAETSASPGVAIPGVEGAPSDMDVEPEEDIAGDDGDLGAHQKGEATTGAIKNGEEAEEQQADGEASEASTSIDKPGESAVIGVSEKPEAETPKDPASQRESASAPIEKTIPALKGEASKQVSSTPDSSIPATEECIAEASPPEESEVVTQVPSAQTSPPAQEDSVVETPNEEAVGNQFSSAETSLSGKEESVNETSPPAEEAKHDKHVSSAKTSTPTKEKSVVKDTDGPNKVEAAKEVLPRLPDVPLDNGKRSLEEYPADVDVETKRAKVNDDLMQEEEVKEIPGEEDAKEAMEESERAAAQPAADDDGDVFDDAE
jgi:hypothetical protein